MKTDDAAAEFADDDVPGQHHLGPGVERFDEAAEDFLDRFRGRAVPDRVFTTASHVGDFSLIWHVLNIAIGIRERSWKRTAAFTVLIGLESLVVNQGVKRLFRRSRPTTGGHTGLEVRTPSTSSFPSGHASSATFAAMLLSHRVAAPARPLLWLVASIVATSRAYVRIHHASDVVAGIVTGGILATVTRRLLRRFGASDLV